jgi:hypothetical protein
VHIRDTILLTPSTNSSLSALVNCIKMMGFFKKELLVTRILQTWGFNEEGLKKNNKQTKIKTTK